MWSSHPLGYLLFNGFNPFQDFFFVPGKLIFKMFIFTKCRLRVPHPFNVLVASKKLLFLAEVSLTLLAPACHLMYIPVDQQWLSGTVQPPYTPSTGFLILAAHSHSIFHCEGLDLGAICCHLCATGRKAWIQLPPSQGQTLLGLTTALGFLKLSWKSLWVEKDRANMVTGSKILLLAQSWPPNWHINFGNCLTLNIPG